MIVNKLLAEDADLVHPNILEEQAAAWNDEERKSIIRKKEEKALAKVKAKANTKGKQVVKKQVSNYSFVCCSLLFFPSRA